MIDEGYRVSAQTEHKMLNRQQLQQLMRRNHIQILLLLLAVIIAYAASLNAPFYLDDYHSIVENPVIRDIGNMLEQRNFQLMRLLGYYSLAGNYAIHGLAVTGYHIFNILIHLLTSIAVLYLLKGMVAVVYRDADNPLVWYLPLLVALIFAVHPLQTQAVTYIIQRHAALVALFYIAAMVSYVYARKDGRKWLYLLTALFSVLALLSKENAVTVFAALLLLEIVFFQQFNRKKIILWMLAGIILVSAFALLLFYLLGIDLKWLDRFTHTEDVRHISRLEYFTTQLPIIWHYIRLFFVPLGLHLDYDIALRQDFFTFTVLIALLAHVLLITLAISQLKKLPLLGFAILFYYLAHSVESGIIPILDLAFEHRTYLPNLGLAIVLGYILLWLLFHTPYRRLAALLIVLVLSIFLLLTIARNLQWADPVDFYLNETRLSPNKERTWSELGKIYLAQGQINEALQALASALNLGRQDDGSVRALPTTFLNTYIALIYSKQWDKAAVFESKVPLELLSQHDRGVYYYMRGNRLLAVGQIPQATESYRQAVAINPLQLDARANLGALLIQQGDRKQGQQMLLQVLQQQPDHKLARLYQQKLLGTTQ